MITSLSLEYISLILTLIFAVRKSIVSHDLMKHFFLLLKIDRVIIKTDSVQISNGSSLLSRTPIVVKRFIGATLFQ